MLAKCGKRLIWHWAHVSLRHCDSWWENETQWHRIWKSCYPPEWQEFIQFDELSGEKHIADIKTDKGIVLEFQNSPMMSEELLSREDFYGRMIWIVNGIGFKNNFHILHRLPRPDADFVHDIVFLPRKHNHQGQLFYRKSESPEGLRSFWVHGTHEIREEIDKEYRGHHVFDWVRPRPIWFEAKMPVYFDFHDNFLWKLDKSYQSGLQCVQAICKKRFLLETSR